MKTKIKLTYCSALAVAVFFWSGGMLYAQKTNPKKNDTAAGVKKIDEVVLIGYGNTKRKNVTGSIASVKMEDVNVSTNTNFVQAMAGRAAGVTVMSTSGQPGAMADLLIRSNASFASSGPLYVVDGVIINDDSGEPGSGTRYGDTGMRRSPLNFLNPNDIETIDILKDASATAIYGARAAGGVVLITTKKGKSGRPTIQYNFSNAFQQSIKYYDLMNAHDYMDMQNKALYEKWMIDNKVGIYGGKDPGSVKPFVPRYTQDQINKQPIYPSAFDEIMRPGLTEQHNISISGAVNRTKYYVSGNYLNQQGIFKGSDYKNFSGKFSIDQGLSDSFKIGVNIIANGSKANNGNAGDGLYENSGMIGAAFYHPPTLSFRDDKGNYTINPGYQNTPNPLSYLDITDYTTSNRLLTSGYAEWIVIPGLTAKASLSYDQSTAKRFNYLPTTFLYGARAGGAASISENNAQSLLIDYTLNYVKTFSEKHKISLLAGHSYQITTKDGFSAGNSNFPTDAFTTNNIGSGAALRPSVGSYRDPDRIWKSYFGRAIYEFNGKYILTASIRGDGASHFAENKKWGIFPSFSAAWIVSEENFLKNSKTLNFLKLRLGYGEVGNSNIGSSAFTYYSFGYNAVFNNTQYQGVSMSQLANPNLTWETQAEKNIGVDFGLFHSRITGTVDLYQRTFRNLLSSISLATDFPVSSVATNIGKTKSTGFEFSIQTKNIVNPNGFNWNSTFNFTTFKNVWVERSPGALKTLARYIDPTGNFNAVYGYLSDGIYDPNKMSAPKWMPGILPGEIIVKDINGYDTNGNLTGMPDGKITDADMTIIMDNNKPEAPRHTFGFGNEFRYKNFDLSIYAYGAIQKKYNREQASIADLTSLTVFGWNGMNLIKDQWRHDNPNATLPSFFGNYRSVGGSSDYYIEDASFIRVRDITLGYRFSEDLLQKLKIVKSIRIFASVQNPFVITKYKGIDPELKNFYAYPITKSFIMGANITF